MEGPTLSPSYTIMKYNALLQQYERNGSDDFLGALAAAPPSATLIENARSRLAITHPSREPTLARAGGS